tara:strand:- start:9984 stop:10865 length:882 start_codon:yes stop_codon:yes gene_type:complete
MTEKSDVPWAGLFGAQGGNPEANSLDSTLPVLFKQFGTFAGPQYLDASYNFDYSEPTWINKIPGDFSFKNQDLGAYLFNQFADYVGWHCDGVSTARITLEHAVGNVPMYMHNVTETYIQGNLNITGLIIASSTVSLQGSLALNGKDVESEIQLAKTLPSKGFDVEHTERKGKRIRHICVEGPESGPIYVRGKGDSNVINLPEYWKGFVDPDSITVHITPIGSHQEIYVDSIEWGQMIKLKSASAGGLNYFYQVWANRLTEEDLIVEYSGDSPADYPGNNEVYSIAGYDYDRRK